MTGGGGITVGGNVETDNTQTFNSDVQITTNVVFDSDNGVGGAAISFTNIDSDMDGVDNLTIDAGTSTVGFTSIGGGALGDSVNDINILAVTGTAGISVGGDVETDDTQTFNSAMTLTTDAVFDSEGAGTGANISFQSIAGTSADLLTVNAGNARRMRVGIRRVEWWVRTKGAPFEGG